MVVLCLCLCFQFATARTPRGLVRRQESAPPESTPEPTPTPEGDNPNGDGDGKQEGDGGDASTTSEQGDEPTETSDEEKPTETEAKETSVPTTDVLNCESDSPRQVFYVALTLYQIPFPKDSSRSSRGLHRRLVLAAPCSS